MYDVPSCLKPNLYRRRIFAKSNKVFSENGEEIYCPFVTMHFWTLFSFPNFSTDIERILKWVSAVGNQSLLNLSVEKISNNYFCRDNFSIDRFSD